MVVHFNFLSGYNWTHHPLDRADEPFDGHLVTSCSYGTLQVYGPAVGV